MRCVSSACTKKREHGSGGPSTYTRPTEKWRATRLRRRSLRRSAAGTTSAHRKKWVLRTAFRIAAGELKRRRNEHGLWTDASYEIPDETAELLAALPRISPKQRAAIVLHYHAGYSLKEVADIIGSTPAAVGVHLHRGRQRLRELL